MLTSKSVQDFLDEVASPSPAPGGGSVASLAGALGAALTAMVCRLTIGKKKYSEVQKEMESVLKRSEELRTSLSALVDEDTDAFNQLMQAFSLPKETDAHKSRRTDAIQHATRTATLVPLKVMQLCDAALPLTRFVAERGNANSISDAGVAALMIHAACVGARLNVQINLGSLNDAVYVEETTKQVQQISERVEGLSRSILLHVNKILTNQL